MVGGGGWLWRVQMNSEQVSFKSFVNSDSASVQITRQYWGRSPSPDWRGGPALTRCIRFSSPIQFVDGGVERAASCNFPPRLHLSTGGWGGIGCLGIAIIKNIVEYWMGNICVRNVKCGVWCENGWNCVSWRVSCSKRDTWQLCVWTGETLMRMILNI